jgi:hypothetical protein
VIVIDLQCESGHVFDGWFASAEKFAEQKAASLLECPLCGTRSVSRKPSVPKINSGASLPSSDEKSRQAQALAALRKWVSSAENVGPRFAEEALRMHHGEIESRDIRGTASRDEMRELVEEGVSVLPVPPALTDDAH